MSDSDSSSDAGCAEASAPSPRSKLSRRGFVAMGAVAATALTGLREHRSSNDATGACTTIPDTPTVERPEPQANWRDFSAVETTLAFRNHGMQAELLREAVTPLGAHYLLIHFDIPKLSSVDYSLAIGGRVRAPRRVSLAALKLRRTVTQAVTLECAGTGRSTVHPRAVYVPWANEDIGTYQWTGTPLRSLLEEAGVLGDAVEVLFTGWDSGIDLGVEHAFERSLPIAEALRDEVMLAWAANGQPLLPQHGFPLRLVVPRWYGMASVKWLRAITLLSEPFRGVQQAKVYRYQQVKGEAGEPVTLKRVMSVIAPPGVPDVISRHRFVAPGRHTIQGTAWSGSGRITRVELSADGGTTWRDAELVKVFDDPYAWTQWRAVWDAGVPGEHVLASRATDAAGNVQPLDPQARWNRQGMGVNGVQRVPVTVQAGIGAATARVPSATRAAVAGAEVPSPPRDANTVTSPR